MNKVRENDYSCESKENNKHKRTAKDAMDFPKNVCNKQGQRPTKIQATSGQKQRQIRARERATKSKE